MTKKWNQGLFCGFDLETTGLDSDTDHIVQIGISMSLGSPLGDGFSAPLPSMSYDRIVDPGVPILNSDIHGITDDVVAARGTPEADAVNELVWVLRAMQDSGTPVVAYNAAFDFTFARSLAARHKITWNLYDLKIIDPMVIDKEVDKYRRGSRRMGDVAKYYGLDVETDQLHSAMYDASLAVQLTRTMGSKYSGTGLGASDFTRVQERWATDQQRSLQQYFTDSGKTDDNGDPAVVQVGWPYFR